MTHAKFARTIMKYADKHGAKEWSMKTFGHDGGTESISTTRISFKS